MTGGNQTIYFDNSATTLIKPPQVAKAVASAIDTFGNASRSFYDAAMLASREMYKTRAEIAALIGIEDPLQVAFTSSSTESLNLVIVSLINKEDSVITTTTEHNSVLRPLYLTGCDLSILPCDDKGVLCLDQLPALIKPTTKFMVCTHGSNLTGNITAIEKIRALCQKHGITLILDISQTFGLVPVDSTMADIFCFTGHKGLLGPQGTGGIITNGSFDFSIVKTGGAGVHSFDRFQQKEMPDIFEVGTQNSHSIYGLQKGVQFIRQTGIEAIHDKEKKLTHMFYSGVQGIQGIRFYGDFSDHDRLPIVSLNIDGITASELAQKLWQEYQIATRAGSHCAPLLHQHFKTEQTGIVRFSFSYFNTEDEIQVGIDALKKIAKEFCS